MLFRSLTASSVLFDAVYVPGGARSVAALTAERDAIDFVTEAYRHCKPLAATGEGIELLRACEGVLGPRRGDGNGPVDRKSRDMRPGEGILISPEPASPTFVQAVLDDIAQHRFWTRAGRNKHGAVGNDETRGTSAQAPHPSGSD